MGYRLSSRTISGMSSSLRSTASSASGRLANQSRTAASIARSTNIAGSYANAFSSYVRNGVNGAIKAVSGLTDQMQRTANQIASACAQFERSANGVVDEAAINAMCAKLSSMGQDVAGLQGEINSALSAASKYISPVPVKLSSVSAAYSRVTSGLRKIVADLHRLNSSINGYANAFYGGISAVGGFLGSVFGGYSSGKGFNLGKLTSYISGNPTINNLISGGKQALSNWTNWAGKQWKSISSWGSSTANYVTKQVNNAVNWGSKQISGLTSWASSTYDYYSHYSLKQFVADVRSWNNKNIIPHGKTFSDDVKATVSPTATDIRNNTHVVREDTGIGFIDSKGNWVLAGVNIFYQPGGGNTKLGLDIKSFFAGKGGVGLVSENVYVKHKQTVNVGGQKATINLDAGAGANFFGASFPSVGKGGKVSKGGVSPAGLNLGVGGSVDWNGQSFAASKSAGVSSNSKGAQIKNSSPSYTWNGKEIKLPGKKTSYK